MNSLRCHLSTEKCPEETIQEYIHVAIVFSPVAIKFAKPQPRKFLKFLIFFQEWVVNEGAL